MTLTLAHTLTKTVRCGMHFRLALHFVCNLYCLLSRISTEYLLEYHTILHTFGNNTFVSIGGCAWIFEFLLGVGCFPFFHVSTRRTEPSFAIMHYRCHRHLDSTPLGVLLKRCCLLTLAMTQFRTRRNRNGKSPSSPR